MNTILRTSALALALLAGTTLAAAPALADRGHYTQKSWGKKHYKHYKHRKHHYGHRGHYGKHRYGWNGRYGHYRHGWYGHRRPAYGYGGPGFSIHIR